MKERRNKWVKFYEFLKSYTCFLVLEMEDDLRHHKNSSICGLKKALNYSDQIITLNFIFT